MTPEQRTTRFQQLSQSYSVLSDPNLRKSYDLSRGSSSGGHRRSRHHAGYTRGSGGMGYAAGSPHRRDNDERRRTANYAWHHPSRAGNKAGGGAGGATASAESAANARPDPFAQRASRGDDHLASFAKRARVRHEQTMGRAAATADSHYQAGTAVFGRAKAEEESRLINDSSTLRSSQVSWSLFFFFSTRRFGLTIVIPRSSPPGPVRVWFSVCRRMVVQRRSRPTREQQ